MLELPIICCNGISDSLLVIGRIPIRILGALGVRFCLFYESSEHPAKKLLVPFFKEIRYVRYTECSPSKTQRLIFRKMMALSQRIRIIWKVPHLSPIKHLQPDPLHQPPGATKPPERARRVLIQTHLDGHHGWQGATAKIWRIENWVAVIRGLNEADCEVSVMEWDAAAMTVIMRECPFVTDATKGSLWELCSGMAECDCVISVDSWVKYGAAWSKAPQVILVPDLRNGYTSDFGGISPQWVAAWWFHGLLDKPMVRVIGLDKINGQFDYTLRSINDLEPDTLLQETKRLLKGPQ